MKLTKSVGLNERNLTGTTEKTEIPIKRDGRSVGVKLEKISEEQMRMGNHFKLRNRKNRQS